MKHSYHTLGRYHIVRQNTNDFEELIGTQDIFENDEIVLIKATFIINSETVIETAVGIKDSSGDIVKIVTVNRTNRESI